MASSVSLVVFHGCAPVKVSIAGGARALQDSSSKVPVCLKSARLLGHGGLFTDTKTLSKSRVLRQGSRSQRILGRPQCVTASPTTSSSTGIALTWDVQIYLQGTLKNPPLNIKIVDALSGEDSGEPVDIKKWKSAKWDRKPSADGTIFSGKIALPQRLKNPGAVVMRYTGPASRNPSEDAIYVSEVVLSTPGQSIVFVAKSWVHQRQEFRVFFQGTGWLPDETPNALKYLRENELNNIKGVGQPKEIVEARRVVGDRIIDYDLFNDLGGDYNTPSLRRPPLGGKGKRPEYKYAYPRRLRTNRGKNPDGVTEKPNAGLETPWVPQDDEWDSTKAGGFQTDYLLSMIPAIFAKVFGATSPPGLRFISFFIGVPRTMILAQTPLIQPLVKLFPALFDRNRVEWKSFKEIGDLYNPDVEGSFANRARYQAGGGQEDSIFSLKDEICDHLLGKNRLSGISTPDKGSIFEDITKALNELFLLDEPIVSLGRRDAWKKDEEFGRQYLAGQNPFTIEAVTKLPIADDSALTSDVVKPFLEGNDLAALVADAEKGAQPRIFVVNYWEPFKTFAYSINNIVDDPQERFQYAGRCLFYQRNDGNLVPVGIELWAPKKLPTDDPAGTVTVYTPNDHPNIWLLAKTVFNSLDSGVHQLVSHHMRSHIVNEAFILSMYRNMSVMHPVYKFLMPHFTFTLRINANARAQLIKADDMIEHCFTPGKYGIPICAAAYDLLWKFEKQAFPSDLVNRRLARDDGKGSIEILLSDYPYAEDGLLIWNALEKWTKNYVELYYKSDDAVVNDSELQTWWNEGRTVGHADKTEGWIELTGKAALVRILATIAWIGSGHHSSANFGQYDYSGYPLNRSGLIRRPIPSPGTDEYKELTSSRASQWEAAFLRYIANPEPALRILGIYEILSNHADNEHYLSDSFHGYIYDGPALKLHQKFVEEIRAAEKIIKSRNDEATAKPTRNRTKGGVPYTMMVPSSGKGLTGQGISYSTTI